MALRIAGAAERLERMAEVFHRLEQRQPVEVLAGLIGVTTDHERVR